MGVVPFASITLAQLRLAWRGRQPHMRGPACSRSHFQGNLKPHLWLGQLQGQVHVLLHHAALVAAAAALQLVLHLQFVF